MGRRGEGFRLGEVARFGAIMASCLTLANCASSDKFANRLDPKYGVSASPRVVEFGQPVPKGGGAYRVGKPYVVAGQTYVPEENRAYRAEGLASWYGDDFHGRLTANGEVFDMEGISAAHPTLPMPCYARVTNLANGRSLVVRVNDRGPYHGNRVMDVSSKAAQLLEFRQNGVARVRVEYVGPAPLEGTDDRQLIATLREGVPAPAPSTVRIASARPFVPQIGDGRREDVPVPMGRPYTLGDSSDAAPGYRSGPADDDQADAASFPSSRTVRAEPLPTPRLSARDTDYLGSRPVAGYAPPPRYESAAGFISGRGLY